MSLNEGTNFSLTASVSYKRSYDELVFVERVFKRANTSLAIVSGFCGRLEITDTHDDCERLNRQLDYLRQFMTYEQIIEFMKI